MLSTGRVGAVAFESQSVKMQTSLLTLAEVVNRTRKVVRSLIVNTKLLASYR